MSEARIQALYEQSESLVERGKHTEALELLHEAHTLDPDSEPTQQRIANLEREMLDAQIDRLLDQAREFLAQGEDEMAFARLTAAEELDATRVDTLELLAELTQRRNRKLADELLNEAWELTENGSGSEAMVKIEEARRLSPDMPGINDRILKIRRKHLQQESTRHADSAKRKLDQGHLMGAASELRQAQRLDPNNAETARLLRQVEKQLEGDDVDQLLDEVRTLMDSHKFASAREKMLEAASLDPQRSEVVRTARALRKAILRSQADEVKRRLAEAREKAAEAGDDDTTDQMVIDPTGSADWGGNQGTAVGGFDFAQSADQKTRRASNDSTIALMNGGTGQIQFDAEDFEQTESSDDFGFFDQDDTSINLDAEKGRKDDADEGEMIQLPASSLIEDSPSGETPDDTTVIDAEEDDDEEVVQLPAGSLVEDDDEEMVQLPAGALVEDDNEEMVQLPAGALVEDDDEEVVQLPAGALVEEDEDDEQAEATADMMLIEDEDEQPENPTTSEMASALAELSAELSREASSPASTDQPDDAASSGGQPRATKAAAPGDSDNEGLSFNPDDLDDEEVEVASLDSSMPESQADEKDDDAPVDIPPGTDFLDPSLEGGNNGEIEDELAADGDIRMGLSEGDTSENLDLGTGDNEDSLDQLDASLRPADDDQPDPDAVFAFGEDDADFQLAGEGGRPQPGDDDEDDFHLADDDDLVLGGDDDDEPADAQILTDDDTLSHAEESGDIEEAEIIADASSDGSSVAMDAQITDNLADPAGAVRHDLEAQGFGYYWAVTSEFSVPMGHPLPYGMEDRIDTDSLPLRRDVVVFYPSVFGEFPELGLHQLFYKKSGYATWRTAFQGWMERHQQKLTSVLKKLFPDGNTHGIHYGVIAKGNWHVALEMTPNKPSKQEGPLANDMDFESDWDEFVRALNDEAWDETFTKEIGFTPPKGCPSFRELRRSEEPEYKEKRKELLTGSWDHFARLYYLRTLQVCRQLCPGIRWGLMGYPATPYMAYLPNNPNLEMFQQINDRLQWLWDAEDVILPMFTATRRTVENGVKPDSAQKQNDRKTDEANIKTGIAEVARVRDKYAANTPIISVHNLEYSKVAGGGPLEQPNFENQFLLPRDCDVDGIMIAGHIISDPQLDMLADELSGRLGQAIKDAASDAHDELPSADEISLDDPSASSLGNSDDSGYDLSTD